MKHFRIKDRNTVTDRKVAGKSISDKSLFELCSAEEVAPLNEHQ